MLLFSIVSNEIAQGFHQRDKEWTKDWQILMRVRDVEYTLEDNLKTDKTLDSDGPRLI